MTKSIYPDVPSRDIKVCGTKDIIRLTGYLALDRSTALFELFINGKKDDFVVLNIRQANVSGVFNNSSLALSGFLEDDISVRVHGVSRLSTRPEYLFYVGDQLVHKEFGDEGGL